MLLRATPVVLRGAELPAAPSSPFVTHAGVLTSLDELDRAAAGRGLISAESTRGVLRRIPLLASVDGTLLPTLAVEMLRVASGAPALGVSLSGNAVTEVSIGTLKVPTESDATVRLYFSPHRADRFVSAVEVLNGAFDPLRLKGQLVLIGLTGIGLLDYQDTPIGARLSGSEIQVQLLENLVEGNLLRRPAWAAGAETLLLLALGAALLWAAPRWKVLYSSLLLAAAVLVPVLAGFALFRSERWLFDAATPGVSLVLLFGVLLALTLAETSRQRRTLEGMVQQQREHSARMSGELLAAQRIQSDTLPRADLLHDERRIELHATLSSAREVGGDMYDYFLLDPHRLFLLVGDVAGKGLSASIFMAVSKALYKNAMLRAPDADIGDIMRVANAEVSRDNAEMLFVTVFAAILDLRSGELSYCNAGHDNPYRLIDHEPWLQRIEDGDGPPLCAAADFPYRGARCTLAPGEMLCLMTDGVSEAQNLGGELYGAARAQHWLLDAARRGYGAPQLVEALRRDVERFSDGAEAADDLTILALRWNGAGEGA
jgi:serine phosphatase RsbU (regulator of sigma subunit)